MTVTDETRALWWYLHYPVSGEPMRKTMSDVAAACFEAAAALAKVGRNHDR